MKIGFIGQGWIGQNYANDFERRGFDVVRYGLEPEYAGNREAVAECEIVFIAVPTPTTAEGFDLSIVRSVLKLVGEGKAAVIKSTVLPGSTELLQSEFPWLYVFHSPEFLTEANAAHDAANPARNIVGTPSLDLKWLERAKQVHDVLPYAPFVATLPAAVAELVKYAGNCFLYTKLVFTNLVYNLAQELGLAWYQIEGCLQADPRIGATHLNPIRDGGRGAGGHCFIKDFAAFRQLYGDRLPGDWPGFEALAAIETANLELLRESGKDAELVEGVYA